jgi:hypothetical protein
MMRTFLIAYDLAKPNRNKHVLASTIMSLGSAWARPLEQTWYVKGELSEADVEQRLAELLDEDDGLLVQTVEAPAALAQTSLRWFRQRRPGFDVGAETNIIAFPSPQLAVAQAELPLAAAS